NEGGISGRHRLIRNLMGFWILQEIRREFLQENVEWDFGALAETAGELPSFRWLFDVDLPEFFHPGDMRRKVKELCARIYGSAPATPAEYTEAVCASLAFKARWAMEKIETLVGRRFKRINIIGGASMNPYVAQTVADLAALPVVCGPTEASALGNVMFQMIAFGEIAGVREGRDLIGGSLPFAFFEPKAAPGAREAYARFVETFEL
ncbi:MAG: FGGY-family carbohydrate kinase, partial [Treponema sp.]|nr:FGGY-family carbohydrate kinase [Treponema sp.]